MNRCRVIIMTAVLFANAGLGLPHDLRLPDEDIERIITALEHYHAYTVAKKAEDARYRELAERLKRKPTDRVEAPAAKPTKRRA
jgi:hypothetical protein